MEKQKQIPGGMTLQQCREALDKRQISARELTVNPHSCCITKSAAADSLFEMLVCIIISWGTFWEKFPKPFKNF